MVSIQSEWTDFKITVSVDKRYLPGISGHGYRQQGELSRPWGHEVIKLLWESTISLSLLIIFNSFTFCRNLKPGKLRRAASLRWLRRTILFYLFQTTLIRWTFIVKIDSSSIRSSILWYKFNFEPHQSKLLNIPPYYYRGEKICRSGELSRFSK